MSETLRIAFVVEGSTDLIVLEEVVAGFLEGRDFVVRHLQPEMSESFQPVAGEHGFGWPGVCRWCLQAAKQAGGRVRDNLLFGFNDLLVVQVDADVAGSSYSAGHIEDPFPGANTLPCEEPCPPASATTDRLRTAVLGWLGEVSPPPRTILCTPSKALETWLLVGLFPDDNVLQRDSDIECREKPETILQGKPRKRRLVSSGSKDVAKYRETAPEFADQWDSVTRLCTEAARFEEDFHRAMASLDTARGASD
ncbi:MAG: hypothetical protein V1792_17430 [Pseudomonadota bacterium]